MTIAAGFRFDDGLLICADTKHTADYSFNDSKIFTTLYSCGARTIFSFAGSMHFARMAIQQCDKAILALSQRTIVTMREAVEAVLLEFHSKHIFSHPDRNMVGGPDFNFLIGLWSPLDERAVLLCTDQTAVNELHTYECLGTGRYLGHYIIRPRYHSPTMALSKVILLATTALMRIKSYDTDCGGSSEFAILKNDGTPSGVQSFDISQGETFAQSFFSIITVIYEQLADGNLEDEKLEGFVRTLMTAARDNKLQQVQEKQRRSDLMLSLAGIKRVDHRNDQKGGKS